VGMECTACTSKPRLAVCSLTCAVEGARVRAWCIWLAWDNALVALAAVRCRPDSDAQSMHCRHANSSVSMQATLDSVACTVQVQLLGMGGALCMVI
jgi:hypothetical protein